MKFKNMFMKAIVKSLELIRALMNI